MVNAQMVEAAFECSASWIPKLLQLTAAHIWILCHSQLCVGFEAWGSFVGKICIAPFQAVCPWAILTQLWGWRSNAPHQIGEIVDHILETALEPLEGRLCSVRNVINVLLLSCNLVLILKCLVFLSVNCLSLFLVFPVGHFSCLFYSLDQLSV